MPQTGELAFRGAGLTKVYRTGETEVHALRGVDLAMAQGEVHIARYYYNRGAYVAAANRAQDVVSTYRQTPATEDALNLMVISYDKLGLVELRDDALRVLERTFPQSRFLESARRTAAANPSRAMPEKRVFTAKN